MSPVRTPKGLPQKSDGDARRLSKGSGGGGKIADFGLV